MQVVSRLAVAFAGLAIVMIAVTGVLTLGMRQEDEEASVGAAIAAPTDEGDCPVEPVCLPMMMTLGNQLTMSGTLFGRHCTFLVDTGFTYSVLSAKHKAASKKGYILLQWDGDPDRWHTFKVKRWVATAQQTTNRLPLVEMGDDASCLGPHGTPVSMQGQLALVQQLGSMLVDAEYDAPLGGIIGASFLRRYVVTFDYVHRCLSYECHLGDMPPGTVRLANVAHSGFATIVVGVTCRYGDRMVKLKACIDTGAGASILSQKATRALLPPDAPTRRRKTHARFGDGDLEAYEYVRPTKGPEVTLEFVDKNGNSVTVRPETALMLPEKAPTVSAMSGHDMLLGTSFLKTLILTIDYVTNPSFDLYVRQ